MSKSTVPNSLPGDPQEKRDQGETCQISWDRRKSKKPESHKSLVAINASQRSQEESSEANKRYAESQSNSGQQPARRGEHRGDRQNSRKAKINRSGESLVALDIEQAQPRIWNEKEYPDCGNDNKRHRVASYLRHLGESARRY